MIIMESGVQVLPMCPFVRGWIERHPDYADLVYHPPHAAALPASPGAADDAVV